jgi:tetratricopeptide (TPR) repeat protein
MKIIKFSVRWLPIICIGIGVYFADLEGDIKSFRIFQRDGHPDEKKTKSDSNNSNIDSLETKKSWDTWRNDEQVYSEKSGSSGSSETTSGSGNSNSTSTLSPSDSSKLTAADYYLKASNTSDLHLKIKFYTNCINLDPDFVMAYNFRAMVKDELNDVYGAISDYTKAIELNGAEPVYFWNRGLSKEYLDDIDGACKDFKKACDLGYEDGCARYSEICEPLSNLGANDYNEKGMSDYDSKNYIRSIYFYSKAIESDGAEPVYFWNRGLSKESIDDIEGACKDFKKACDLGDEDGCARYSEICDTSYR